MSPIAEALRAQARALEAVADALEQSETSRPRFYSRGLPPADAASWRAALETSHREGVPTIRSGRQTLIDAAAWDARIEPQTGTRGPRAATPDDEQRLKRMGLRSIAGGRP